MQNNLQSSLLQGYINSQKNGINHNAEITPHAFNNTKNEISPKLNLIEHDTFDLKNKKDTENKDKQKKAKLALISTLGMTAAVAGGVALRHRNDVGNFIKKTYEGIKNSKKGEEIAHSASETGRKIQVASDNLINGKDTLTRKLLSYIPGYKTYDKVTSSFYRKITKGVIKNSWEGASKAMQEADTALIEALKKAGKDENSEVIKLLQKRMTDVKSFAGSAEARYNKLDESLSGIHEDGFKKLKEMFAHDPLKNGKKFFEESIGKDRLEKCRAQFDAMLKGHEYGGLTKAETITLQKELEPLLKENPELKAKVDKAMKAFQKAYAKESVSLFPKLRDINFGSAPTDGLTLISAAGGLGVYASQADTKEEKVGVTLTTGIPLLATLSTTTFATSKMVSGGKSLGMGLAAGWLANKIGKKANEKYQEASNKKYEQTIMTLDDVKDKIKTDIGLSDEKQAF